MPGARLFVLPSPWALFDIQAEQAGYGRIPLDPNELTEIVAGRPVYLAVPAGSDVRISGYKMAAHRLGWLSAFDRKPHPNDIRSSV